MEGWYRLWIPNDGLTVTPPYEAVKGEGDFFEWNPKYHTAFIQLKAALMSAPAPSEKDFFRAGYRYLHPNVNESGLLSGLSQSGWTGQVPGFPQAPQNSELAPIQLELLLSGATEPWDGPIPCWQCWGQ